MKRKVKTILSIFLLFTLTLFAINRYGIIYNNTPSFPIGIYKLNRDDKEIRVGKLILICPPDNYIFKKAYEKGYVSKGYCPSGYKPLIKKIKAISGDSIKIDSFVYINNQKQPKSNIFKLDSSGNKIVRYNKNSYTIKDDEIFLLSDYNKRSFDSRYFGPLKRENIVGSLRLLIKFNNNY